MAQSISLWGATYNNVPAVNLPKSTSGTARFTDTSPTTAAEPDVTAGKIFFKSDGSQAEGTGTGSSAADVVTTLPGGGDYHAITGVTVAGSTNITQNGTYDVSTYASAVVNVTGSLQSKSKTYTPTTSQQTESVRPDNGYDGLSAVNVTVNAMPSGTAGTPTATKGTVSNHSVSVTPSVTNTGGYITGGTKTGTAVTVSASELVSGNKEITANGTGIDVANYSTVSVNVSGSTSKVPVTISLTSGSDGSKAVVPIYWNSTGTTMIFAEVSAVTSGTKYLPPSGSKGLLFVYADQGYGVRIDSSSTGTTSIGYTAMGNVIECDPNASVVLEVYRNN